MAKIKILSEGMEYGTIRIVPSKNEGRYDLSKDYEQAKTQWLHDIDRGLELFKILKQEASKPNTIYNERLEHLSEVIENLNTV